MNDIIVLTRDDLESFKNELISQLKEIQSFKAQPKWLRSREVCEMLGISQSVLQQLRINGDLPAAKLSTGTWLYPYEGIVEALEAKTNGRKRGESC